MSEDSDSQVIKFINVGSFYMVFYVCFQKFVSQLMKNASFQIEEDCPTFRPFTRESLAKIEARLEEVNEKKRELEKKRAEGEVNIVIYFGTVLIKYPCWI